MPRKKNADIESGSILVSFSLRKDLKPHLVAVAQELGLKSTSALLAVLASDPNAAVSALRPLVARHGEREVLKKQLESLPVEKLHQLLAVAKD